MSLFHSRLHPSAGSVPFVLGLLLCFSIAHAHGAARTRTGLQLLYEFTSAKGATVKDRSGAGEPLDLHISNPKAVQRSQGSLTVRGKTLIHSKGPATQFINAIHSSRELTIEAWIRPAKIDQTGPARILTLSKDSGARNFTLGQDGDHFEVRFRTSGTSANGIPALTSTKKSLSTQLTHVVYTRNRGGRARIYINGKLNAEIAVPGSTSSWDKSYRLALANELSNDRPWEGTYQLVAIYSRDLSPGEIEENYRAGAKGQRNLANSTESPETKGARLFHTEIAPLIAKHCLECHDSGTRKGKLDLSRKAAALAGSSSGVVLVPGRATESALWEAVQANEMPEDRPPLSDREKKLLREWIDGGAVWPTDFIDPAIYALDVKAKENWLRRLTLSEYIETVRSAVGVDIAAEARLHLPKDLRADGFNNTAYNLNVDLGHVEAYARLAEIVAAKMDPRKFAARYSKNRQLTDNNMRPLVAKLGQWLLRGPLADHEIAVYRGISTTVASAGGSFEDAVRLIVEAMLQSPRFIYRIETQRGDGSAWPVDDFELASRLSYILWGGPPDAELMKAAAEGDLSEREGVRAQVQRMLKDPRVIERSTQFIVQWLNLDRLNNLQPNKKRFPHWRQELAADMREETVEFFKEMAWKQNRPLSELFNAQLTFASPRLARHYGLKPASQGTTTYDLSSVPGRGGLLTHASVLTVGGDEASMVTRGLFVLHDLLRGVVKAPPPCVDTTPVPTKPGLTQRAIAEVRIANKSCGGCHSRFEPLAFGLEKFDGIGAYHENDEHGNTLHDNGEILFPGTAQPVPYKSSEELMNLLAGSERIRQCLTWKVAQFALGRPLVGADAPVLEKIHQSAQKGGGTYASLITAIVMSDLVQLTQTETSQ